MKQKIIRFTLLLLLLSAAAVYADDFSPEFIQQQESMLRSIDQYFPRLLITETFDTAAKPEVSELEDSIYGFHRITRAGKWETMISAAKPAAEMLIWTYFFTEIGFYSDFYGSIEGRLLERDDSEKGAIHIGYSDKLIVGESGASYCEVNFPISIIRGKKSAGERDDQIMADLTQYGTDYDNHLFEIIRLDGYTSIFIDGRFITGFADGFSGRFYFTWGDGLYPGGKYAAGQFDNVRIRVR